MAPHATIVLLLALSSLACQGERIYKVTSILSAPYLMRSNDTGLRGNDIYKGFIADLLAAVAKEAGFRYEIELVRDHKYGERDAYGLWSGMIGELIAGKADLSAAPLTRSPSREAVVDFSYPFQSFYLTALMRKDIDIHSIEELANQTEVAYGTVQHGTTKESFHNAKEEPYTTMWASMSSSSSVFVRAIRGGVNRVLNQNYALLMEYPTAEYLALRPPCNLKLVGKFTTDGMDRSFGFALQKNHPLLNDINVALLHLQDDMTIARIYRKWWTGDCDITSGAVTSTLNYLILLPMTVLLAARVV